MNRTSEVSENQPSQHDGGFLQILLAEDNPVNQRLTQLIMAKLGHQLDIVNNGREAVDAVTRTNYDVVLMDIEMPCMNGLEAARRIRAHFGDQARPYIVAVTASIDRADCLDAGMDDYLLKPVRVADLADTVERALHQASHWRREQTFPP